MISIPVSVGELIDKLSILQIKLVKIDNPAKKEIVSTELAELTQLAQRYLLNPEIEELMAQLKNVNSKLWDVEDNIRVKEKDKAFDEGFIQLARSVYFLNDRRFSIKNQVNELTNSQIKEVKDYIKYQ